MSTATLDLEEVGLEPVYQMPRPRKFQLIAWYGNADKNSDPLLCYAHQVNENSVQLTFLAPGRWGWALATGTRHITDPKLESSPNQRQNDGAWDFLPDEADPREYLDSQLKAVWKRLDGLDAKVNKLSK